MVHVLYTNLLGVAIVAFVDFAIFIVTKVKLNDYCYLHFVRKTPGHRLWFRSIIHVPDVNFVGFVVNSDFDDCCYSLFVADFQLNRFVYDHQDRYFCDID